MELFRLFYLRGRVYLGYSSGKIGRSQERRIGAFTFLELFFCSKFSDFLRKGRSWKFLKFESRPSGLGTHWGKEATILPKGKYSNLNLRENFVSEELSFFIMKDPFET